MYPLLGTAAPSLLSSMSCKVKGYTGHFSDMLIFGKCIKCNRSIQPFDEVLETTKQDDMDDKIHNHDCTLSEEDGCTTCEEAYGNTCRA